MYVIYIYPCIITLTCIYIYYAYTYARASYCSCSSSRLADTSVIGKVIGMRCSPRQPIRNHMPTRLLLLATGAK